MKIAFIRGRYDPHRDAVSLAMLQLAMGLSRNSAEVHLITAENPRDVSEGVARRSMLQIDSAWNAGLQRVHFLVWAFYQIVRLRPDVVISLEDPTGVTGVGVLSRLLLRSYHIAWIMDLQNVQYRALRVVGASGIGTAVRVTVEMLLLKGAGTVVVLGVCMKSKLRSIWPYPSSVVIPIWHLYERDQGAPRAPEARRWTSSSSRGNVVNFLYAGHASHRHPLLPIASAFSRLSEELNVKLRIVGSGPSVDQVRDHFDCGERAPISIQASVAGSEVEMLLDEADVHIAALSVHAVGTCVPSKVYASMSSKKPLLLCTSSNSQAAIDVGASGGGVVADLEDIESIEAAIAKLASGVEVRTAMGERAEEYYWAQRSFQHGLTQWMRLIAPARASVRRR